MCIFKQKEMSVQLPGKNEEWEITETRTIRRITIKQWLRSIPEAFDLERGVVFTLRRLFIDPGAMTLDYLGRNRFHYVPSFRLLVVTTAFVLLLINSGTGLDPFMAGFQEGGGEDIDQETVNVIQNLFWQFFNLFLWLYLPFGAAIAYLFNRKKPFNFAEHLVFQSNLLSLANIFSLVLMAGSLLPGSIVGILYFAPVLLYNFLGYRSFFQKSWIRSILEVIVIVVVSYILYFVFLSVIFAGIAILQKMN